MAKKVEKTFISKKKSALKDLTFGGVSFGNICKFAKMGQVQRNEVLLKDIQNGLFDLFSPYASK